MDIDFVKISVSTWNTLKLSWQYADGKKARMADGSYSEEGEPKPYYYKRHAVEIINAKIVTAGDVYVDRIFPSIEPVEKVRVCFVHSVVKLISIEFRVAHSLVSPV